MVSKSSLANLSALAESPLDEKILFAGSGDGCPATSLGGWLEHKCSTLTLSIGGQVARIRALEPTVGLSLLASRRGHLPCHLRLSGPGRVCAGLGVDLRHDGLDLEAGVIGVGRGRREMGEVASSPRVGIRRGTDRRWRFYLLGHPSVSGKQGFNVGTQGRA